MSIGSNVLWVGALDEVLLLCEFKLVTILSMCIKEVM